MEIKSIGTNIVNTIKSPFKQKSTSSNPFENHSFSGTPFKGSVLPFADVFQTAKNTTKVSKLQMMSASVIGAVSNFGHKVSQPLVNLARNVRAGYNHTVNYIKTVPQKLGTMKEAIAEKINLTHSNKTEASDGIKILDMRNINTKAKTDDLRATWLEENRLEKISEEVA